MRSSNGRRAWAMTVFDDARYLDLAAATHSLKTDNHQSRTFAIPR
jgi:hypothetical protein